MAEPLTSSDILRERMGFGVSPLASSETRRAYAAAGLSPLGTQERERFERGGAPSPMTTQAEKEAWVAAEVVGGRRDPMELPKAYGGLGDRPEATTRRGLRMQQEWDKQYEMMLAERELARKREIEERELSIRNRSLGIQERQEARLQAAEAKAQEEMLKVSEQADSALNEILGGFDSTGNPISGLDPDSPDYMQRRNDIIKRYPKALNDDAFKTAISTTDKSYFDKMNFDQQLQVQEQADVRMLGKEERMVQRQAEAGKKAEQEKKEEDIVSQERSIQKSIRDATQKYRDLNASMAGRKSLSKTQQASLDAAKNTIIDLQVERAALRGLAFESEEDAEKANPPSGSTIYIGRKPFKVP